MVQDELIPTLTEFGAPEKFSKWRTHQTDAILRAMDSPSRIVALCMPTGIGKSVVAVGRAVLAGARAIYLTSTKGLMDQLSKDFSAMGLVDVRGQGNYQCVSPDTKILTADLQWVDAGTLQVGDLLLAFEEEVTRRYRRWRVSEVETAIHSTKECLLLIMEDGTNLVCTKDHKWLVKEKRGKAGHTAAEWIRSDELVPGKSLLCHVMDVWNSNPTDYDSGFLAAAYDGEGSLSQLPFEGRGKREVPCVVSFNQSVNPMFDFVVAAMQRKSIPFRINKAGTSVFTKNPTKNITIRTRRDAAKFLGMVRPPRLLGRWNPCALGALNPLRKVLVKEIVDIGEHPIVVLNTSTRTFVANGFAAHNCIEHQMFGSANATPVDSAPCHAGVVCPSKESTCTYFKAVREARQGRLVVTNYTYWMLQNIFGDGLGNFDLMICDEAHESVQEVCGVLSTTIEKHEVEAILNSAFPHIHAPKDQWKMWSGALSQKLDHEIAAMRSQIQCYVNEGEFAAAHSIGKRMRERKDLKRRLDTLYESKGDWVMEMKGSAMTWDPVWPQAYTEQMLFWHTPRVLLMSATVRPKTLGLLGIADTEYEFIEYPSIFPKERRPIYRIPTVRLNKNSDADDYRTWVQRIDQWISKRLDRKGIVHTVSYNRAKLLLEQSSYKKYMMAHSSKNTRAVVEAFRKSSAPAILVSPVMDTGYDFQGDTARWQAIGKMPWPDTRSAVMRARIEKDPDYAAYLTAQALVQMCGRICRSEEDWGETGIFDDNFNWFVRKYNEFLPQHFKESVRWVQTIPEPLKL